MPTIPIHAADLSALIVRAMEDESGRRVLGRIIDDDLGTAAARAVLDHFAAIGVGIPDPVGITEITARAGVGRSAVDKWRSTQRDTGFPEPRWWVGGRAAWEWADVLEWGRATGRVRDGDVWAKPGQMVTPSEATA